QIRNLHVPAIFSQSPADKEVPPYMVEELYNAAPGPKKLVYLSGSHDNAFQESWPVLRLAIEEEIQLKPSATPPASPNKQNLLIPFGFGTMGASHFHWAGFVLMAVVMGVCWMIRNGVIDLSKIWSP